MNKQYLQLVLVIVLSLILVACDPNSNDIPSLAATPTPVAVNEELDDEKY